MSELILAVGDDNVQIQNLDTCSIDLSWDHKKGTTVKFGTEVGVIPSKGLDKLGIVVWFDRDKVDAVLHPQKAANPNGVEE